MEKPKAKARQASLLDSSEDKGDYLDKLVAQAFDSDPKVRLRVAQEVSQIDDPRAIFALIELSSDKDPAVKEAAQRALGQFKENKEEEEAIVSLEKIFAESREVKKPEEIPKVRQKMMPTLEKLFAHYEPKKRDSVKRKLLPSLEKLFFFSGKPADHQHSPDPLQGLEKISPEAQAIRADIPEEKIHEEARNAENFPFGQSRHAEHAKQDFEAVEEKSQKPSFAQERREEEDDFGEEKEHQKELDANKLYAIAYRIATTPGFGKAELKREQNRLLSGFKKELALAFKMAEERAKQDGMSNFSGLKPGMKNLSFAEMVVVSVSGAEFGERGKKRPYAKVVMTDGQKEQAVLIPQERAKGIEANDRIILKGVNADFLVETSEVVLVVKPKSKVLVSK
ncbi:MAG: HEAT repeat domain-containing protein [Candidatus Micrarchaeota archaeon]|nr:HEAT repeat domain-containing protein [Candidatus Micrarchaeota archaeon]